MNSCNKTTLNNVLVHETNHVPNIKTQAMYSTPDIRHGKTNFSWSFILGNFLIDEHAFLALTNNATISFMVSLVLLNYFPTW